MALNLANLFTALGRCGRNAFLINGTQNNQGTPYSELAALSYINPTWIVQLTQGYDQAIRSSSGGMSPWIQAAQSILLNLVSAVNPNYGASLPAALSFLNSEMIAQGASVAQCTIGVPSVTPDPANVGIGSIFVTTTRGDGLSLQNTVAENTTLLITQDSYVGGATRGQEPWQWSGKPNLSSLNTGAGVGLWDWDWPQGSGASASGRSIAANAYNNVGGNFLTNGDMATWTGGPAVLSNWNLVTGTWGTDIRQSAVQFLSSPYSTEFLAGTGVLTALTQQFGSGSTVSGVTAGTPAALIPYRGYAINLWLKATGAITGGVLSISLVDSTGTVINDQSGVAQTQTLTLSTVTTSWKGYSFPLRLPVILPADGIIRLRIKITTALTGNSLFMDDVAFCVPVQAYPGGPNMAVFSSPANPFEGQPDPDGWTIGFTNNRAGATFGATWQTLINRLFQTPGLILPYSGPPGTILDTLITGA
jgi:hypothetical protein